MTYLKAQPMLHGAVARGAEQVEEFVRRAPIASSALSEKCTTYALTPLHIAVLTKNVTAAKVLLDSGASLFDQDYEGNTPLSLAVVVGDIAMVRLLASWAKLSDPRCLAIENDQQGSPQSLIKIVAPPKIDPDRQVGWILKEGRVVPMDGKTFKEKTGRIFCNYIQTPHIHLFNYWVAHAKRMSLRDNYRASPALMEEYRRNPPKLYLASDPQLCVRTDQDVAEGALLLPFGGKIHSCVKASVHRMGEIYYDEQCNLAALVEEGFPNVYVNDIFVEGCPQGVALFALEPLKKGQRLTLHSGSHQTKLQRYTLHNKESMEAFCSPAILDKLAATAHEEDSHLLSKWFTPLEYILTTPAAWFYLAANNKIDAVLIEIFEKMYKKIVPEHKNALDVYIALVRGQFKAHLRFLEGKDFFFKRLVIATLQEIAESYPVCIATQMLQFDIEALYAFAKTENQIKEAMRKFLVQANALKDFLDHIPHVDNPKKETEAAGIVLAALLYLPYEVNFYQALTSLMHGEEVAKRAAEFLKKRLVFKLTLSP